MIYRTINLKIKYLHDVFSSLQKQDFLYLQSLENNMNMNSYMTETRYKFEELRLKILENTTKGMQQGVRLYFRANRMISQLIWENIINLTSLILRFERLF